MAQPEQKIQLARSDPFFFFTCKLGLIFFFFARTHIYTYVPVLFSTHIGLSAVCFEREFMSLHLTP